jgi:hypothetical protein
MMQKWPSLIQTRWQLLKRLMPDEKPEIVTERAVEVL